MKLALLFNGRRLPLRTRLIFDSSTRRWIWTFDRSIILCWNWAFRVVCVAFFILFFFTPKKHLFEGLKKKFGGAQMSIGFGFLRIFIKKDLRSFSLSFLLANVSSIFFGFEFVRSSGSDDSIERQKAKWDHHWVKRNQKKRKKKENKKEDFFDKNLRKKKNLKKTKWMKRIVR